MIWLTWYVCDSLGGGRWRGCTQLHASTCRSTYDHHTHLLLRAHRPGLRHRCRGATLWNSLSRPHWRALPPRRHFRFRLGLGLGLWGRRQWVWVPGAAVYVTASRSTWNSNEDDFRWHGDSRWCRRPGDGTLGASGHRLTQQVIDLTPSRQQVWVYVADSTADVTVQTSIGSYQSRSARNNKPSQRDRVMTLTDWYTTSKLCCRWRRQQVAGLTSRQLADQTGTLCTDGLSFFLS